MARAKKVATAGSGSHIITTEPYKSQMMNRTLHEPVCSCGWVGSRWSTAQAALEAGEVHANA